MNAPTTDKTEDQIAKERAAVAAFKNAQAAMTATLSRCDRLERALSIARDNLVEIKRYVGASAYAPPVSTQNPRTVHAMIDAMVAEATKYIGAA